MNDGITKLEARAARLAGELRRELNPETDLWPRIAARIASEWQLPERLPQSIATKRDLWPGIRARIESPGRRAGARPRTRLRGTDFATAAGIAAVAVLAATFATRLDDTGPFGEAPVRVDSAAIVAELPEWMADALGRLRGDGAGLPVAALGDVASSIERDFLMVRAERRRIEQALAVAGGDMNLRTQWRQVYLAELRLMDETEKLTSIYGTRTRI